MKQFFGYLRISTDKQDKNLTDRTQRKAIANYSNNNDITIIEVFKDIGSGKQLNTNLLRLLDRLEEAEGLLIYDQSRLTRNPADLVYLQDKLKNYEVHTTSGKLDLETPEGILVSDFIGAASRYERLKTSQRTKDAYLKQKDLEAPNPGKKTTWGRPKKIKDALFNKYYFDLNLKNKSSLAKVLGVSRKTLYAYLKEKGLYP